MIEKIKAAAIRLSNGKIYEDRRHYHCIRKAIDDGNKPPIEGEEGFTTTSGRFVDRKEAAKIAHKAKQTTHDTLVLFSEDIFLGYI